MSLSQPRARHPHIFAQFDNKGCHKGCVVDQVILTWHTNRFHIDRELRETAGLPEYALRGDSQ